MLDPKKLKYRPYSFSKINMYQTCPRKFKYFYIDKLPVPEEPQVHLDRGNFIHLLFEYDGDPKLLKNDPGWNKIKKHGILTSKDLIEAKKAYEDFLESDTGKALFKPRFRTLLKEFPIGLDGRYQMVPYDDPDVVLRGYLDNLTLIDGYDNTAILTDYKTGRYKPEEEQNWSQLLWYSIALFNRNPELDNILLVFAYVDHKKTNKKMVERKAIPRYEQHLEDQILKIESDQEFSKNETSLCDWCQFEEICRGV